MSIVDDLKTQRAALAAQVASINDQIATIDVQVLAVAPYQKEDVGGGFFLAWWLDASGTIRTRLVDQRANSGDGMPLVEAQALITRAAQVAAALQAFTTGGPWPLAAKT